MAVAATTGARCRQWYRVPRGMRKNSRHAGGVIVPFPVVSARHRPRARRVLHAHRGADRRAQSSVLAAVAYLVPGLDPQRTRAEAFAALGSVQQAQDAGGVVTPTTRARSPHRGGTLPPNPRPAHENASGTTNAALKKSCRARLYRERHAVGGTSKAKTAIAGACVQIAGGNIRYARGPRRSAGQMPPGRRPCWAR